MRDALRSSGPLLTRNRRGCWVVYVEYSIPRRSNTTPQWITSSLALPATAYSFRVSLSRERVIFRLGSRSRWHIVHGFSRKWRWRRVLRQSLFRDARTRAVHHPALNWLLCLVNRNSWADDSGAGGGERHGCGGTSITKSVWTLSTVWRMRSPQTLGSHVVTWAHWRTVFTHIFVSRFLSCAHLISSGFWLFLLLLLLLFFYFSLINYSISSFPWSIILHSWSSSTLGGHVVTWFTGEQFRYFLSRLFMRSFDFWLLIIIICFFFFLFF